MYRPAVTPLYTIILINPTHDYLLARYYFHANLILARYLTELIIMPMLICAKLGTVCACVDGHDHLILHTMQIVCHVVQTA